MFFPDEIRPIAQVPNLPEAAVVNDKELTMAKLLIEQLSTPFEPIKYRDDYRENLQTLISQKVAGEEVTLAPAKQENNVIDLMAALQASIEAAKPAPMITDTGEATKATTRGKAKTTTTKESKSAKTTKSKTTATPKGKKNA
jgi:DNA end-binding protein Ku